MTSKKKPSKIRERIHQIYEENELASLESNRDRARSFSIGSATGGIVEVSMRGDFSNLWYHMQPVEAIEFINQLAAATGVEIAMRPRNDFSSWRSWDTSIPNEIVWLGAAPWQLNEEKKTAIQAAKEKNIKSLPADPDCESKSELKTNTESESDKEDDKANKPE